MSRSLHIICHEIPYPPDYGGLTDLFYKIKTLHSLGVSIKLHAFRHRREPNKFLNQFCESVEYYPRRTKIRSISFRLPYIVSCRRSDRLLENLAKDDDPILMEGIHTSFPLTQEKFKHRKCLLRLHNVEFLYYRNLAESEKGLFKQLYFLTECRLLKKYENWIAQKTAIVAVSQSDADLYTSLLGASNICQIPVFVEKVKVQLPAGKGLYCLYHGNLSVPENQRAAEWLIKNVFARANIPFVIAGKCPGDHLKQMVSTFSNICLEQNPSDSDLEELVAKAQVHVLPSFNETGVKLKIIYALFHGRFVLTNPAGVRGSGLATICELAEAADEFLVQIRSLMQKEFEPTRAKTRQEVLGNIFNNEENGRALMRMIW